MATAKKTDEDSDSPKVASGRERVLALALEAVTKDRNIDYGNPEDNFADIAGLWNSYFQGKSVISPTDVAVAMILMKVARIRTSPMNEDHWVDIAGYAACGFQTALVWSQFLIKEDE